ncbi:hypothetical protein [Jannaschia sp. CCS1]|uniref:hypothetical protein n=1 Tax=Jannaschia sp. (strain CCS1) TaxID=290400 RepID=UPI000053C407|nr:hypothetical protein [Jannaschia sp. CCS1]ABD53830.1 hypothetical protein Jann_0913 [Jannaschia sp. CCS1]
MVHQFAIALIVGAALPGPVAAQTDPYATFLEEVAQGDGGACRRLMVQQRVDNWYGPSVSEAFASVEEIMADITGGPEFRDIGCNRDFRDAFVDCSSIDDPRLAHIVPRGVRAATMPEQIALMRACLDLVTATGEKPGSLR